jgi:hypothetical protein
VTVADGSGEHAEAARIACRSDLRVTAKEPARILGATIIQANHEHSNCDVSFSKQANRVNLTFDFLDYRQGFEVEVIHTGTLARDLELNGSVIEGGPLTATPPHYFWGQKPHWAFGLFAIVLGGTAESTIRLLTGIRTGGRDPIPVYEQNGKLLIEAPRNSAVVDLDGQKVLQPNMEMTYFVAFLFFFSLSVFIFRFVWTWSKSANLPVGLKLGDSRAKATPS